MSKTIWRISVILSSLLFGRARYRRFDDLFHDSGQRFPGNLMGQRPEMPCRRAIVYMGMKDVEFEREMGEDMRDPAGASPLTWQRRRSIGSGAVDPRRPARRPLLGHPAEQ